MKKFFLLMTAMILAVGAFAAERVIYCKVAQSWWKADGAAVAAYAWSGEGDETVTNAKWPGLRMNPVEGQEDVWSTNFDLGSYEKIIFVRVNGEGDIQDWGAKTDDLTIPADENDLYVITSETAVWDGPVAGKWTQLASGGDPDPDPEPEPEVAKFYITGDSALVVDGGVDASKQWQADAIKSTEDSYVLKLKADQDYKLKITENGQWESAKGFEDLTRKPEGVSGDKDGNICFKLSGAAPVKVTYIQGEGAAFLIECENFYVKPDDPEPEVLYYIAGTMTDWATNKIAATSVRTTLELKAGDHKLKVITLEDEWKGYKDLSDVPKGVTTDDDGNICFTLAEDGNVIISYSKDAFVIDGRFYVKPVDPEPDPAKFYITGDSALVVDLGLDKEKAWKADAIKVTSETAVLRLKADQDYQLKITENGQWESAKGFEDLTRKPEGVSGDKDGNICFKLTEAADVKVTYIQGEGAAFLIESEKFYVKPVDPEPEVLYYIAGTMTDWATNKIAATSVRTTLELKAGDHKLKVVTLDEEWKGYEDLSSKPEGVTTDADGNICFTLAEDGNVIVSYSKDAFVIDGNFYVKPVEPEENIVVYVVNKLKWEKVLAYIWRVEGEKAIPYAEWPGIEMSIPKQAPALAGVVAEDDQVFVVEFPKEFDQIIFNNGAGEQTVDLSLDEEKPYFVLSEEKDSEGHYTGEWQQSVPGGDPDPEPEMNYYIAGSMTDWQVSEAYKLAANPEVDGEFLGEFTFAAGDEFKVVYSDGATVTDNHWFPQGMENNYKITEDGQYTVYFRPAGGMEGWHEGMILAVKGDTPQPEQRLADGYYLIGSKTDWNVEKLTADLLFAANEGQEGEFVLTTTLEIEQAIKVVKVEKDVIVTWFPDGEGNEYKVDADHAGEKTIYFRPAGNAEWAAFGGFIWIDANPNEAIDNIADGVKAVKVLRDGTIYILRNGKTFDVTGKMVK